MMRVTLDAELRQKPHGFHESIELVDDAGQVIGEVVRFSATNP